MKPVIKKQTHYSVLLMRDDTETRKYRVHSRTLRFLVWFFLLLVAGGAAGITGGVHYWKKYRTMVERYDAQEREVSEMKLQLERLVTLETLLSASNGAVPQARHAEVGVSQTPVPVRNATAGNTPLNGALAAHNATASGSLTAGAGAHNATIPAVNATARAAQQVAGNATALDNLIQARDFSHPQISDQESPLRVTGFNGRATGQQRLRISYELSAEGNDEQRMISGQARYFAVFSNGTRMELSAYDSEGSRFSITRMKLMQNSVRLPQGYRASDVEKIDVLIELNEGKKFEERFGVGG
ncbi:MAG: hypothetical protein FWG04_01175 [Desulfovibrionaceae bacterium]|nr:hypothetical protein [Desulfovibrionaceae bacterium]